MKKPARRVVIWGILAAALYVLCFGPAWGLYKRHYVFSKPSMRLLYKPLVVVAAMCPGDWASDLLGRYIQWFEPDYYEKTIGIDDTFD